MAARDQVARHSNFKETGDFIPTPPFATRALFKYAVPHWNTGTIVDPACGQGHMCRVFKEVFGKENTHASDADTSMYVDAAHYEVKGYDPFVRNKFDYVVTNPPYALAEEFVHFSLGAAKKGVALLMRVQFLEGQKRYKRIFTVRPPSSVWLFSDRIPFKTGVVVKKAPKMFFHCWVIWDLAVGSAQPTMHWFHPDVQNELQKEEDYY